MKSYRVDVQFPLSSKSLCEYFDENKDYEISFTFPDGPEAPVSTFAFPSSELRKLFIQDIEDASDVLNVRTYEVEIPSDLEDVWPIEVQSAGSFGTLYHVSPGAYLKRILREGLRPGGSGRLTMSSEVKHPDRKRRIYFTTSLSDAEVIVEKFYEFIGDLDDQSVAILKVELPPGTEVYEDWPCVDVCPSVYVRQGIPPKYIEVVEVR